MRRLLLFFSLAAASTVQAQKIADPKPYAGTITAADLKRHLYIVASKDFEGRETATEGQRKAAAYIENHFRSLGLKPGNGNDYQLYYPVFQDSLEGTTLTVNNQSFELNKDYVISLANNYTADLKSSEVVFAGYGLSDSTHNDYKNLNVKGKIVLLLADKPSPAAGAPRRYNPYAKLDAAGKNGAIAVLIVQPMIVQRAPTAAKGNMYLAEYKKAISPLSFSVTDNIAKSIMGDDYAAAQSGTITPKTYTANIHIGIRKTTLPLQSSDVLGFLEGTDLKDQIVVLSAHYDHLGKRDTIIWYGADDDGSGTVSILELAEAFAKAKAAGKGPRRSILFLANSGEEKGLFGSEYYSEHPTYPLDHTTVDLNIDMIGRIDPNRKYGDSTNYVYVVGDDKLSTDLKPISIAMNKKYTHLELDYKFNDPSDPERIYYRSDHYNFARKGVPIIFYFDGIHADYHKPTDTPDKINYDIMEKRARLVFYTAWEMANRNDMLKRDIPLN